MHDSLERGRASYRRRSWSEAYDLLSLADRAAPLEAGDLDLLATSAYLTGRERDFLRLMDRVHHEGARDGHPERAARAAFWIALTLLLRGETGQANGWLARARRHVEGRPCVEHGYLLLPAAEQRLAGDDGEGAHAAAAEAAGVGDRFGDADLVACARHLQGRALIRLSRVDAGLAFLDEAMLAATRDELSPILTGLIYCSVIAACQQVFASGRAREWTSAMKRWCEQQPEMVAFTRTCLVHRAEILELHGAWPDAMAEARRACEGSAEGARSKPPGSALYRRAEIHRLRGESAAAEQSYRSASRAGCEPQPGLALLRLAQGRSGAACAAIRRALDSATDRLDRTRLLPACVEILLAAGDVDGARRAARELEEVAQDLATDTLKAMAAHAQGAVDLAGGEAAAALGHLRRALGLWRQIEAPYEAARVRVLMGLACRALGDDEAGDLEFEAAGAAFEGLGAVPEIDRLEALGARAGSAHRRGLTPRELQVLRLVAAGKTNKAIGSELSLSERTIDRHVSNILTKLDVPSRAAATAYAYDHKLF